jgi:hypothetical protein
MTNWELQKAYAAKFGGMDWGDVPKVCATVGTWDELMQTLRQALRDETPVNWGEAILTLSKGQVYEPSAQELMATSWPP